MQFAAVNLIVGIILILVFGAGLIVLQIFLSKKESKWPGLILPIISFGISLLAAIAILLFSVHTGTMAQTINGEIVEQTVTQINDASSIIVGAIVVFAYCNIPTGIFLVIYAVCWGKRNRQRALEKMSVQDLE
jgi:hypothetical protein